MDGYSKPELSPEQVAAVHRAVKLVAERDQDRAKQHDGIGYNRWDSQRGHELAGRRALTKKEAEEGRLLVKKYRRQIPKDVYEIVFPESKWFGR